MKCFTKNCNNEGTKDFGPVKIPKARCSDCDGECKDDE